MNPFYGNDCGKLFHGDCLEVMKGLESESVDLVITSPPYPGNSKMWGELYWPENRKRAHEFLGKIWMECLRVLRPGCKLIINIANCKRRPYIPNTHFVYESIGDAAEPLGEIIWSKHGQLGVAFGSYCNPSDPALADMHEYFLLFRKYGNRRKRPGYFLDAFSFKSWRNSVWKIAPAKASKIGHVAPFPKEIPKRLILLYSYPGEVVLDPFLGSGTTAIVAENLDRKWIGIEIEESNCELATRRIKNTHAQLKLDLPQRTEAEPKRNLLVTARLPFSKEKL